MLLSRNFEIAEGWTPGSPQVLYRPEVEEELGTPSVDYDALGRFFVDELQVPKDFDVKILLRGTGLMARHLFGHPLGSYSLLNPHYMNVDAIRAESYDDPQWRTMGIVAHEGRHLSDRVNAPVRTFVELTLGAREKYERHARDQQAHPSLAEHQDDISFPNANSPASAC